MRLGSLPNKPVTTGDDYDSRYAAIYLTLPPLHNRNCIHEPNRRLRSKC
ncbi:hypothetical protein ISN45_At05g026520 [Arabidopsis thaliana x Arabidopsis arenosa]|uniref:Uncharacterized protein n=1 Tax=Arabidopsis thaliana x Arabidopsis arenosa TaxID=1240361 RepID=A0A8T2CVX8_9BRAS|nr:hypothetical protein ISN45_At05g026520 [Arabidopsis thaliana x Arabidopsis arenosa]